MDRSMENPNDTTEFQGKSSILQAVDLLLEAGEHHYNVLQTCFPSQLPGGKSLSRKIKTELAVLQKGLLRPNWLKLEHVQSSNLHQLGAVVQLAEALRDKVDGMLQKFRDEDGLPVYVDVVANGGLLWLKVLCRCPNTLQLSHYTGGRPGERPPLQQAQQLQQLAASHTVLYTRPQIALVFCKGVGASVHEALTKQGVLVLTPTIIPNSQLSASQYCLSSLDDSSSSLEDSSSSLDDSSVQSTDLCDRLCSSCDEDNDEITPSIKYSGDFCTSCDEIHDKKNPDKDKRESSVVVNKNGTTCAESAAVLLPCNLSPISLDVCSEDFTTKLVGCHLHGEINLKNSKEKLTDAQHCGKCKDESARADGHAEQNMKSRTVAGDVRKVWPMWCRQDIQNIAEHLTQYSNRISELTLQSRQSRISNKVSNVHSSKNNLNGLEKCSSSNDEQILDRVSSAASKPCHFTHTVNSDGSDPNKYPMLKPKLSCSEVNAVKRTNNVISYSSPEDVRKNSKQIETCVLKSNSNVADNSTLSYTNINSISDDLQLKNDFNIDANIKNIKPQDENLLAQKKDHNSNSELLKFTTVNTVILLPEVESVSKNIETATADDVAISSICPCISTEERRVCLDVPCMVAYISNTCNGHSHYEFQDRFLREQAHWEQEQPVKDVIERYWKGCVRVVCREAVQRFQSIVGLMAGPEEYRRAQQLLGSLTVVPDTDLLSSRVAVCGGVTASSRIIFGTALHHRAPIITANRRFLRSAASQGVHVAALLHSPRALTELKQNIAASEQA